MPEISSPTFTPRRPQTVLIELRRPHKSYASQTHNQLLQGIIEQARQYDWHLLDAYVDDWMPAAVSPRLDGAMVVSLPDESLPSRLRESGCPVVRIGFYPHSLDHLLPAVLLDYRMAGRMAADHFHERGFRHLAFAGREPWGDSKDLCDGCIERAAELDISSHLIRLKQNSVVSGEHKDKADVFARWARQIKEELSGLPKPVGLLSFSDMACADICIWCAMAGLSIPEDVAVLGVGNNHFDCELATVRLSSIDMNREQQGRRAAILLHDLLSGKQPPASPIMIPPKGIEARRSTDILAVADPLVARSVRFMWDHLTAPLNVADVASEMGVARRKLERAFRKSLGRGVKEELRRKRLHLARQMLRNTDLTVAEIADATCFGADMTLYRAFRAQFGVTPRQFRIQAHSQSDKSD